MRRATQTAKACSGEEHYSQRFADVKRYGIRSPSPVAREVGGGTGKEGGGIAAARDTEVLEALVRGRHMRWHPLPSTASDPAG